MILSEKEHADGQLFYTQKENEQFKAILNAIIGYNITIEIIGSWIWCFDCYQHKDQLGNPNKIYVYDLQRADNFNWLPKQFVHRKEAANEKEIL